MRASDFLFEASIFTKPDRYTFGHKVRVGVGSKNGKALLSRIQDAVPDFDPSEDLEWVEKAPKRGTPTIQFGTGDSYRYFKRPGGSFIAVVGTDKAIQTALVHAPGQKGSTAENKGDLSEPILSAAVVAKLLKRGADNIEDIDVDDLKRVLMRAINAEGQSFSVNDRNSKIADTIRFTIALRAPSLEYIKSDAFWNSYAGLLPSAVHYANSGQIDRYADYFYKNGKADEITIKSDGMSEQKSRKTDIEAFVNGRPLKNLNISLKAGSPHIGQVGGGQITNPTNKSGVYSNAVRLFSPFGVKLNAPTKPIASKVDFWVGAYQEAAKQIKSMLAGQDIPDEANIVQRIVKMVTSHGTAGDPNVKLVSLVGGISTVHSFKGLEDKLTRSNINLDAEYRQGTSKTGDPRPEIRILDKNSGRPLIYIRYSSTQDETKVWNTIEMKELLKELTTLQHKTPGAPAQPAPEPTPAPAAQAPVAKKAAKAKPAPLA